MFFNHMIMNNLENLPGEERSVDSQVVCPEPLLVQISGLLFITRGIGTNILPFAKKYPSAIIVYFHFENE